jgi:hypothetical protein
MKRVKWCCSTCHVIASYSTSSKYDSWLLASFGLHIIYPFIKSTAYSYPPRAINPIQSSHQHQHERERSQHRLGHGTALQTSPMPNAVSLLFGMVLAFGALSLVSGMLIWRRVCDRRDIPTSSSGNLAILMIVCQCLKSLLPNFIFDLHISPSPGLLAVSNSC